jgi:membrane carboxypeptidase/penicillin-binding protein
VGTAKTSIGKWLEEQKAKGRAMPQMAGKTGTTNDCFVAWFSGFTPDLVLTIYIGYDQHRSLGPTMTGGRVVGPVWAATMDKILRTRTDWKMKFDVPPDIEFRDMCSKSGERATQACFDSGDDVFKNAAFKRGTEPNTDCTFHGGSSRRVASSEANGDSEGQFQPQDMNRGQPVGQPLQRQQQQGYYPQQQQPQQQRYYGYR